jgi:sugar phosphate isomerase/epimerase
MRALHRRTFLQLTAAGTLAAAVGQQPSWGGAPGKRQFTMDLVCGSLGVKADFLETLDLAQRFGFESIAPAPAPLAKMSDGEIQDLKGQLAAKKLVWGAAGLPVEFRADDARFRADLAGLPNLAKAMQRAGATRFGTWLSPCHATLDYAANLRQHAQRLREVAKVLADAGQRLGLEYVGPKTSWTRLMYPFIHTQPQMLELIAEIKLPNVGLVLDSWHWYTAGHTEADLLKLANRDVVACDLNDAPRGLAVDEQIDSQRDLPAATGVIDLKTFLGALVKIGYDGPVRAEPFSQALRKMPKDEALAATAAAMKKAFALVQ